ncbi:unnamed protein product [Rangifer tarandus platyrhynchus]|uniref:Uncharacterized protein n=2 Tax=Rangifer tarandus platyrhynchus TaxID=3082113 RepID=A0ABN8YXZ4_RANTA|nr:unnamed protein product [Rangifer tarandus platyrhynchus]CAI9694367.1 unnamed protein product [Rangifer tarandus platyrhynchus]
MRGARGKGELSRRWGNEIRPTFEQGALAADVRTENTLFRSKDGYGKPGEGGSRNNPGDQDKRRQSLGGSSCRHQNQRSSIVRAWRGPCSQATERSEWAARARGPERERVANGTREEQHSWECSSGLAGLWVRRRDAAAVGNQRTGEGEPEHSSGRVSGSVSGGGCVSSSALAPARQACRGFSFLTWKERQAVPRIFAEPLILLFLKQ